MKAMNQDSHYSTYYDNALKFFEFSAAHENWNLELDRNGVGDILDYYDRVKKWYKAVK